MNLAIIGSGKIVDDLFQFIGDLPAIHLTAIYGREKSLDKLKRMQLANHIDRVFTDYDQLLENENIDTLYIALPNDLHFEYAKRGLEAGKHVIVEKPFVQTLDQFETLKALALVKHRHLYEAISNQYSPNFNMLKSWISKIAPIHFSFLNYSQYSSRYDAFKQGEILPAFDPNRGGGALQDLNIYNIHVLVGLFGKPEAIRYLPNMAKGVDTSGILTLKYHEAIGSAFAGKDVVSIQQSNSVIEGEQGYIKIESPSNELADISLVGSESQTETLHTAKHRMYFEFETFEKSIREDDYVLMSEMLNHTQAVLEVLETAKKFTLTL